MGLLSGIGKAIGGAVGSLGGMAGGAARALMPTGSSSGSGIGGGLSLVQGPAQDALSKATGTFAGRHESKGSGLAKKMQARRTLNRGRR